MNSEKDFTLPYITSPDLYISGEFKKLEEDFIVEEVPLYDISGEGQHLYIKITKQGITTQAIISTLVNAFEISHKDVGYAGQKDKHGITTQQISLSLGATFPIDQANKILSELNLNDFEILGFHTNKLKLGHLKYNKFKIKIRNIGPDDFHIAKKIVDQIKSSTLPNFYGTQRFGSKSNNHLIGKSLLQKGQKIKGRKNKFYVNSYQSYIFNKWLSFRIQDGLFEKNIDGDIIKHDRYTGPIVGYKMQQASLEEKNREESIFADEEICFDTLKKLNIPGSRRAGAIAVNQIKLDQNQNNLDLSFSLPKGSYATTFIRELIKTRK